MVRYLLLEDLQAEFKIERGLRQGGPLSPFPFLIVAEGLCVLIKKANEIWIYQEAPMGSDKISASH